MAAFETVSVANLTDPNVPMADEKLMFPEVLTVNAWTPVAAGITVFEKRKFPPPVLESVALFLTVTVPV